MSNEANTPPLTAAEALVLRDPNKAQGREALKLTLMELLARRAVHLRQEERKGFLGRVQRTGYVQLAPDARERAPRRAHVQAVLDAVAAAGSAGGATMAQLVAQARKVFGADLSGYQARYVRPALVELGLLEERKEKSLLVFSVTRYRHTPAGEAALRRVEDQVAQARSLPAYLDSDPARAAALALGLGSTILLLDEMKPHYARLSQAIRERAGAGDSGYVPVSTFDDSSERPLDLDSFDGGGFSEGGFDFDLGAFDALDSSLDAFDSSFDSSVDSGGDGGGDGGGGGE